MTTGLRLSALLAALVLIAPVPATAQGTKPAPKTAKPPAKAAPPPKQAPAAPVAVAPPAPPPPTDVRFKSRYTAGEEVTESVSYFSDRGERYELGDIILIKQRDPKRNIQISRAANSYVVVADAPPVPEIAAPRPPGVVTVTVSIVDLGERKDVFGQTARRVRTVIERTPDTGACDQSRLRTETDGWYIDTPKALLAAPDTSKPAAALSGCKDEVTTNETGDPKLLGFPVSYRTTLTDLSEKEPKATESAMEIVEFEIATLDQSLFEISSGLAAAADIREFTKSISDANEAKLANDDGPSVPDKKPGTVRIGVPEITNKTAQSVDTRALRSRLIAELTEQKIDAIAMAAGPPTALDAKARQLGVDYLLIAEVTDLKTSKPGGLTKMMKATAKEEARDITEAKLSVQLVPPGGKPRLSKNTSGKDGGVGLKTTLKVAKFAGSVYMKFYMGGMLGGQMSAINSLQQMNLGGMGTAGSMMPMYYGGGSVDRTAYAANFVVQQVMAGAASSQGGPSYDVALENAIEDAGKDLVDSIKKATPAKK